MGGACNKLTALNSEYIEVDGKWLSQVPKAKLLCFHFTIFFKIWPLVCFCLSGQNSRPSLIPCPCGHSVLMGSIRVETVSQVLMILIVLMLNWWCYHDKYTVSAIHIKTRKNPERYQKHKFMVHIWELFWFNHLVLFHLWLRQTDRVKHNDRNIQTLTFYCLTT